MTALTDSIDAETSSPERADERRGRGPDPRPRKPASLRRAILAEKIAPYTFLAPWLIGFFVITLGPMLVSLYLSFTDFSMLAPPEWVGVDNYVKLFTNDPKYLDSVRVTLIYVLVSVPLQLAFALLVALVLNRGLRGLSLYRSIYYLPSLIGASVAIAVLWRQMFGSNGLINQVLDFFGIQGMSWIGNPETALGTLIILNVWTFGSPMVIFLAALRQIPEYLYEAAAVDGISRVGAFRHITLPMLSPVVLFNLILQMIGAFQAFTPAFVVSGGTGGPVNSTLFYTLYLYQRGFTGFQMGYASAMAWILFLGIALVTAFNFWFSKYWVHYDD
ncbi:carbohydrate ABC transporter permease [Homoserinibacter sp. GY 40078]|uniref:carbohydrate ABC transporter permease n=1 Tax=Homoserinibacter sp. GY 40078 TaxID=2603275 RepID=UPI0011CA1C2E|nr:sugar ABC transporter permease [Homoserinibacter sp. GY 40078]TXK18632.1 sugar ABC transporter permease [Homoserinibacter sp. GY 40078]